MDEYDVVLLPTFAQVEGYRKRHVADRAGGLFAQAVTTFGAWVADLWELHGDGRQIVDSAQRRVLMQAALAAAADGEGRLLPPGDAGELLAGGASAGIALSTGVVDLACTLVRDAAGLAEFEGAVEGACAGGLEAPFAPREAALLAGVGRYYDLLDESGFVEPGRAAAALAGDAGRVFSRPVRVLVDQAAPPSWQMRRFFDACDGLQASVREAAGADGVAVLPDGVEPRFGFPSGRYAQPGMVADIVRAELAAAGGGARSIVVAAADPLALYDDLEAELCARGVACSVQARKPFAETDFGRTLLSLDRVLNGGAFRFEDLSDAARPPYSGFSEQEAVEVDTALRADRIAEADEWLGRLRAASDTFSQLEEVALDPDADILLGVFEQIAFSAPGRSEAWRAEQLAALQALRSCTSAARRVGADMRACMDALRQATVPVSHGADSRRPDGEGLEVTVTTQDAAAAMPAGSCEGLVLCDLTSEDYAVADRDDAAATLFAKMGLVPDDSALARARRSFRALQELPVRWFACLRPLNDSDGSPTYPSAMLQEFVDAYRSDPAAEDDLDGLTGLPGAFAAGAAHRGEELLYANAVAAGPDATMPVAGRVDLAAREQVSEEHRGVVALGRRTPGGAQAGFSPSPSQVELYLECPWKWFAERRLKIEELDEGFGALERGSFAHAVLQGFYGRFSLMGHRKVTGANLPLARETMLAVADELELAQYEMEAGGGRYVAATQMERREVRACKDQLVSYLDFEAAFLPTFHPAHLEFQITPEMGVEYAGRPFVGIVDRIDVDDAGNAVVVDYKGSLSAAHEIAGKGAGFPGKVQTRMYAQAVARVLGLNVVGALYVSYGSTRGCAGAYDGRALEAAHLPGMRHERSRCAVESQLAGAADPVDAADYSALTFPDTLDATERLVARAVAGMQAGDVTPAPVDADACTYCPVAHCSKRGA